MAESKRGIGVVTKIFKTKNRRRSKPIHLRGQKKLGPKNSDKGQLGRY